MEAEAQCATTHTAGPVTRRPGRGRWPRRGWAAGEQRLPRPQPTAQEAAWGPCWGLGTRGTYLGPAGEAGRGGGGAYLALAEGGAVVDLVAAGALAQGLAATVHAGLLQEDRLSVVGTLPRDTEGGLVTGTRPTRISCPCLTDSEQEAGG